MTLAELIRALESKKRLLKSQAQERAFYDYTLASLIARGFACTQSENNTFPEISEVYPALFDSKEIEERKQEKKDELSIARFKQFAQSHNQKFKKE